MFLGSQFLGGFSSPGSEGMVAGRGGSVFDQRNSYSQMITQTRKIETMAETRIGMTFRGLLPVACFHHPTLDAPQRNSTRGFKT